MSFTSDRILFEDNHYIAVNKLCSDIVQPDKTGDEALLEQVRAFIKKRDAKPGNVFLEVTHRIDRPVSSVVLFAKTSKGVARMNQLFQEGAVHKIYWAIVKNCPVPESRTLEHYIIKDSQKNKSFCSDSPKKDAKLAKLKYRLVGSTANYYFLEIDLLTGRHHQIRCQLAKIGCPIRGDLKYGYPRSNPGGGINLHSRLISFTHPISQTEVVIVAPTPEETLWAEFNMVAEG